VLNADLQLVPADGEEAAPPSTFVPGFGASGGATDVALVRAAAAGDARAWECLVDRFTPALRAAARGFRLAPRDVEDVVQATWLAGVRHIRRLQKPEAIGAWLVVTARRESLRILQQRTRQVITDDPPLAAAADDASPERIVLDGERRQTVRAAVQRLPDHQRLLVDLLITTPYTSYADLSSMLEMPVGSIGPTRERAFGRLRRDPDLVDLLADDD
jgi:RNA polymerase sigma factor (sigma-70 family)